jgi:hypothetical protein
LSVASQVHSSHHGSRMGHISFPSPPHRVYLVLMVIKTRRLAVLICESPGIALICWLNILETFVAWPLDKFLQGKKKKGQE